jgi:hypothetical protein
MTKPKPDTAIGAIHPDYFYRKSSPEARGVIGLGPTQTEEAIKQGKLPPPVDAYDGGRATGWLGRQLIELQRQRLAKAEERQAGLLVQHDARLDTPQPPKRRGRPRKMTAANEAAARS